MTAAAKAGADGIVLVTNRLDPKATGTETFRGRLKELLDLWHSHNVLVSTGGFIEQMLTQGPDAVARYIDECKPVRIRSMPAYMIMIESEGIT